MEAKACAKHIRISPRKARQVMDLIRGKNVQEAFAILRFMPNKGGELIEKVLKSAVANAEQGPTLKRFRPRAQGRADVIRKRTSHITVIVTEKKEG